jgi:uncharacterized membrane protein
MDKELVIVVPNEAAAYEVVKALKGLDEEGSIELYSSTVVVKSANGPVTVKDTPRHLRGPWTTALGVSTGALLGLLAGPAGAAAGAVIGGAAAIGGDLAYSGFAGDFVHDIAANLQAGSYAVCASLWEDWTVPVDLATAPFGAVVFRQATDDVVAAQIGAEWQATKDDVAHLEAEISRAAGDQRVKLEARRDELRKRLAAQREKLQNRVSKLQESRDARIASIRAKVETARSDVRARHQQHVEKLSHFAAAQRQAFHELLA